MQPLIKDTGQVIEAFMAALLKRDGPTVQKMFTADGMVVDFEANSLRGPAISGFLRDWPPPAVNVKRDKVQIMDNMATINLTLMGGGYIKPTPCKILVTINEAWKIKSARFTLGAG
jgi:hypothetical protein